jgi:hypothetical protein
MTIIETTGLTVFLIMSLCCKPPDLEQFQEHSAQGKVTTKPQISPYFTQDLDDIERHLEAAERGEQLPDSSDSDDGLYGERCGDEPPPVVHSL